MRLSIWLTALMLGLVISQPASAQFGPTSGRTTSQNSSRIGLFNTSGLLSSPFRLTDIFSSSRNYLVPAPRTMPNFPDPNSPGYLKGFGFKKLY